MSEEYNFKLFDDHVLIVARVPDGVVCNMLYNNRVRKFYDYIAKEDPEFERGFIIEAVPETLEPYINNPVIHTIVDNLVWNLLVRKPFCFLDGHKEFYIDKDETLYTVSGAKGISYGKRLRKIELPNPINFKRETIQLNNIVFST